MQKNQNLEDLNVILITWSFPLPFPLPWNLRIRSSSDKIQLGRIPQDKHLWYLDQNIHI